MKTVGPLAYSAGCWKIAAALLLSVVPILVRAQSEWVATWVTSPVGVPDGELLVHWNESHSQMAWQGASIVRGTFRYRMRISQGGEKMRLTISNSYPSASLKIGKVSIGLAATDLDAKPESLRTVQFAGVDGILIPAGGRALSDPIDMSVANGVDLIVNVEVPDGVFIVVYPSVPNAPRAALASEVDATMDERLKDSRPVNVRPLVSEIDVFSKSCRKVIVTLGDSITDGMVSDGERGWPGALARRLAGSDISVVNAGIGGNRLLGSDGPVHRAGWTRVDDDVFVIPGLTHIIVLEGINDICASDSAWGPFGPVPAISAADLIAAYRQIIAKAHIRHVKVIGATILPFGGSFCYSKQRESIRQSANAWIRTSGLLDGVIDFDLLVRDPAQPEKIRAEIVADPIHPNQAGYRLMGKAIDLNLFN